MGDLSTEPSMEEILSSIKRIIAEEGETAPGRGRRAGRPTPPPQPEDEVLELSDPMPQERFAEPARAAEKPRPVPPPAVEPPPPAAVEPVRIEPMPEPPRATATRAADDAPSSTSNEPMVSSDTAQATRGALDQLSRLLIKPEPGTDGTLEGLVREMLRPMLRDWLDANLPALVEDMVAREIDRITSSRR